MDVHRTWTTSTSYIVEVIIEQLSSSNILTSEHEMQVYLGYLATITAKEVQSSKRTYSIQSHKGAATPLHSASLHSHHNPFESLHTTVWLYQGRRPTKVEDHIAC